MKRLSSLTVFFPVYNDGEIVPYVLSKTFSVLPNLARKYEVLLIDDGSAKETADILKILKSQYPSLRVITHAKNRGYGGALQTGFKHARYEWVFYTDSDGQYDPFELKNLVEKVTDEVDVVNGYKMGRADGVLRKATGTTYNWLLHRFYILPIRDIDCDFRLIRTSKVKNISLHSSSGTICLELIEKLAAQKAKFKEIPIHHHKRLLGRSQFFRSTHLISMLKENFFYLRNHKK